MLAKRGGLACKAASFAYGLFLQVFLNGFYYLVFWHRSDYFIYQFAFFINFQIGDGKNMPNGGFLGIVIHINLGKFYPALIFRS